MGTVDQAEERVVRFKGYQSAFMRESNRVVCVFGGKGSGKTFVGAHFALSQIEQGRKGLILLNSYSQVRDIFVQSLEPLLKEFGYVYDGPGVAMNLVFNNGALVHLRSSDAEVIKRIESIEYDWGWADEASYYKHESLRTFVSRIRKGPRLIRITSMPDEPDAFIYRMADGLCEAGRGQIFEVGLDANPDESFVDSYTQILRSTYSGSQLRRYLDGARVSIGGTGAFQIPGEAVAAQSYDPNKPLILSWDFNVEYCAVSGWQEIGLAETAHPIVACVRSWQLSEPTVYDSARSLVQELRSHRDLCILIGDASGSNRTAISTDSMWKGVRDIFYDSFGAMLRFQVPDSNPLVKDTVQCVNWALGKGLVFFDRDEKHVVRSLNAAKLDKYGDLDKTQDYKAEAVRTHDADTARYALWYFFSRHYPGSKNHYFIV